MQVPASDTARVDWRYFNEAVTTRAAYLNGLLVPQPDPPPPPVVQPPVATVDWLRRGLAISAVLLAMGIAGALVLWALRPEVVVSPTTASGSLKSAPPADTSVAPEPPMVPPAIAAIPTPEPPVPQARVVTNFVRFTSVNLGDLRVSTGWRFTSSEDTFPASQWCHAYPPQPSAVLTELAVLVGNTDLGVLPYDARAMQPLAFEDYHRAVGACNWAPGTRLLSGGR